MTRIRKIQDQKVQNTDSAKKYDLPSLIGLEGISQRHCIKYNQKHINKNLNIKHIKHSKEGIELNLAEAQPGNTVN